MHYCEFLTTFFLSLSALLLPHMFSVEFFIFFLLYPRQAVVNIFLAGILIDDFIFFLVDTYFQFQSTDVNSPAWVKLDTEVCCILAF